MKGQTTRRPRHVRTTATDPPPASVDTSGRTTCDDCERRPACRIDQPPNPIQAWLWDQEHPFPPLTITNNADTRGHRV